MENIDVVKQNPQANARLRYRLKDARVYVSSEGYHFTSKLDEVNDKRVAEDERCPPGDELYIETQLQAHAARFYGQVETVASYLPLRGAQVLDVGCGGGLFLSLLREHGSEVAGIEVNLSRSRYARSKHDLKVHGLCIEDDFWTTHHSNFFDVVTMWDVIEHVNFPLATIQCARKVLKPSGFLFMDTPCRNSFYHRFGAMTYKLSAGRFPTFLNSMYSEAPYGHKQIFSTMEMRRILEMTGMRVVSLTRFHELTFPYDFYLEKMFKSRRIVRALLPLVRLFFKIFKIRNKMLVVAQKPGGARDLLAAPASLAAR